MAYPDKVEVTREMVVAGVAELWHADAPPESVRLLVIRIYEAMERVRSTQTSANVSSQGL